MVALTLSRQILSIYTGDHRTPSHHLFQSTHDCKKTIWIWRVEAKYVRMVLPCNLNMARRMRLDVTASRFILSFQALAERSVSYCRGRYRASGVIELTLYGRTDAILAANKKSGMLGVGRGPRCETLWRFLTISRCSHCRTFPMPTIISSTSRALRSRSVVPASDSLSTTNVRGFNPGAGVTVSRA